MRGGTALHKLLVTSPHRYSEDINLVQIAARPIGAILNAIRSRLDPILGTPLALV
ncbi:MAG: nucleotidyl transferase AbiEii/AbiGii toxin family protein [Elusimicrobia bacterium]|nr:nucleotidyl transferase AbiEii/AbiGii toxin family protein [Elusimicrobiota bacterium]